MLIIQIVGIAIAFFSLLMVLLRFKKKELTLREFTLWGIFWIILGVFVVYPELMSRLANLFGVGRGVDIIIYLALILLFYLMFKINIRMERIEQDITKIVKEEALKKK